MIARRLKILVLALLIAGAAVSVTLTVLIYRCHVAKPNLWQMRAEATADNPTAARQVILDGIYADKTFIVMKAYQSSFEEKPWRAARIATFAHAAEVANVYCNEEINHIPGGPRDFDNASEQAAKAVKSIVLPPEDIDVHTDIEKDDRKNFQPTRIADAWLAWASFSGAEDSKYYRHALALDPRFGEVYYEMATTRHYCPPNWPLARKRAVWAAYLDRAEQLEPKLHTLITLQRFNNAQATGNNTAAIAYLREYLRLWPTAFEADMLRRRLAQLEAAQGQKHGS